MENTEQGSRVTEGEQQDAREGTKDGVKGGGKEKQFEGKMEELKTNHRRNA